LSSLPAQKRSSMESKYEPDALRLSKREILGHFDTGIDRLKKNKGDNRKVIAALMVLKQAVRFTIPDNKLPYYWLELTRIIDAIRTENELRATPNTKKLAELQKEHVAQTILEVPKAEEVEKRFHAARVVFGSIRQGGMSE
jgi:hypothetical protein